MSQPQPAVPLPAGTPRRSSSSAAPPRASTRSTRPTTGSGPSRPPTRPSTAHGCIVRRPPAGQFSGTVIVEWFNVSAIESSPDWAYLSEEIGREGDAYIGVSAQAQGVEGGGDTLLDVDVDAQAAAEAGVSTDTAA